MARQRTVTAGLPEARARMRAARAYLQVAELVVAEEERGEFLNVSAGLAVLAGVAAADAVCARRVGQIHRGDDHRDAAALLERSVPDGAKLAATYRRLIDLKDEAHYGVYLVSARKARDAVRWAHELVVRAAQEVER